MTTKVKLIADGVITPDQITLTTASTGTNTTAPATTAFVQQEISALVDSSPDALNTLNELAAALGDDANFSTTVTNSIATKLPLAGGTLTGDLNFGDNDKAIFGTGSDLQIYHDGFNTNIKESGAGSLLIDATNTYFRNAAGTKDYAWMVDGGAVSLFHNNAAKLATTATGIDVTGTATMDGLIVQTTTPIVDVLADANEDASLRLRESGTGIVGAEFTYDGGDNQLYLKVGNNTNTKRLSVSRDTGDISFYEDTGTTAKFFWDASAESLGIGTSSPAYNLHVEKLSASGNVDLLVKNTGTDGTSNTRIMSYVSGASGGDPKIGLGITGVRDYFFRIDNSDSDKLKLDTNGSDIVTIDTSGNVGIGTDTPGTKLHIAGANSSRNTIVSNLTLDGGTSATNPYDGFGFGINFIGRDYGNAIRNYAHIHSVIENQTSSSGGGDAGFKSLLSFYTNSGGASGTNPTEKMRITSAGNVGIGTDSPTAKLNTNLAVEGSILAYMSGTSLTFDADANIAVTHSSSALGTGTAAGLLLANNNNSNSAPSPLIAFSAKSALGNHNHTYATLHGEKSSSGADNNWNTGALVFSTSSGTGPNERMRIKSDGQITTQGDILPGADVIMANGRGISFAATANSSGSMSSELLDDYEEGTWTPVIQGLGGNAASATVDAAFYTKIGRMVHVTCFMSSINIAAITSGNYIILSGLPFTATSYGDFTLAYKSGGWTDNDAIVGGYIQKTVSYAYFVAPNGIEQLQTGNADITKLMFNTWYVAS